MEKLTKLCYMHKELPVQEIPVLKALLHANGQHNQLLRRGQP